MKQQRIYVDTSVFGGCFDPEFAVWSKALMEDFRATRYALVLSDVTASEISMAPSQVQELFAELQTLAVQLPVTGETLELFRAYESRRILGRGFVTTCCTLPLQLSRRLMFW